jgi:plasmid stabilization system protein ParE
MVRSLEVHPAASAEAAEAIKWYFERSERASAAFQREVARAFTRIERAPETYPPYVLGTCRFLLRRFPYEVVYRVYPEVVHRNGCSLQAPAWLLASAVALFGGNAVPLCGPVGRKVGCPAFLCLSGASG